MLKSQKPIKPQFERFIEAARQLECDENKDRFEEKLKRIATAKSEPKSKLKPQG